ncbi:MAG TPA: CBS domain-containing protein [Planctomycetota bacterium]|nr:CBS domain-containing protein [Planctomycetota bacterium]
MGHEGLPCHAQIESYTAQTLMRTAPPAISADATLPWAATFLCENRLSAAPVVDDSGRLIGVISLTDLAAEKQAQAQPHFSWPHYAQSRLDFYERTNLDLPPDHNRMPPFEEEERLVRDIMTPHVYCVTPETPATRVIEQMLERKVHRLFVASTPGQLVGVISTFDILRALSPARSA